MIFRKNLKFPPSFSFVKTNLEKVFANDLDWKKGFPGHKNIDDF